MHAPQYCTPVVWWSAAQKMAMGVAASVAMRLKCGGCWRDVVCMRSAIKSTQALFINWGQTKGIKKTWFRETASACLHLPSTRLHALQFFNVLSLSLPSCVFCLQSCPPLLPLVCFFLSPWNFTPPASLSLCLFASPLFWVHSFICI